MYRNLFRNSTIALGTLLVSSSLVFAAGLQGSVTALDGKGMATVRSSDGKDHQVKAGQDFKVGSKVDCDTKNNVLECRLGAAQSAVQPTSTTPAPAASMVKPNPTTAPTAQTPAPPTAAPTVQAPAASAPAQPAAMSPAPMAQPAPAQTSSATPSTSAPAPASK